MIYNVYAIFFRVVGVWVGGLVGRISNSIRFSLLQWEKQKLFETEIGRACLGGPQILSLLFVVPSNERANHVCISQSLLKYSKNLLLCLAW